MKEEAKDGEGNEWSKWKMKKYSMHRQGRNRVAEMRESSRRNWNGTEKTKV